MKVILKQDIKGVGKKDQIINANDGYARNYLFPKDLAIPADKSNMNNLESKKASQAHKKELEKKKTGNLEGSPLDSCIQKRFSTKETPATSL